MECLEKTNQFFWIGNRFERQNKLNFIGSETDFKGKPNLLDRKPIPKPKQTKSNILYQISPNSCSFDVYLNK